MKKKVNKMPKYSDGGITWKNMSTDQKWSTGIDAGFNALNLAANSTGKQVTAADTLKGAAQGAMTGFQMGGPWGALIGGVAGGALSSIGTGGSVDYNTGTYTKPSGIAGLFGHSEDYLLREANVAKNSIMSNMNTQKILQDYYNKSMGAVEVAEGGMIQSNGVLAKVTAGEVYRDSNTGEWGIVKGKGMNSKKPKQDDAEIMIIPEGSMVINKHKDYVYPEWGNRTGADIMKPLAKPIKTTGKYAEGTKSAIDAIGKKVLNKQELRKAELHNTPIPRTKKYAKYSIGADFVLDENTPVVKIGKSPIEKLEEELFKPQTPTITGKDRRWYYHANKFLNGLADVAPIASTLFKKSDYEKVEPRIGRNYNIPVKYSIDDVLVDNLTANAINNYNVGQKGGGTGAYLAAANQSATNLMKANSQARIYQKNKQNELIARNVTQVNDWERYANNQLWAADVATAQNKGMAQQMDDQAKKDAYEFYIGKKYDKWKLSMLEPMLQYGTPSEAYSQIYKKGTMV